MSPLLILVWLLVTVLAGFAGYFLGAGRSRISEADAASYERLRLRLVESEAMVAKLKDLAWDHRELDPNLATILIDEIRTYEKRELEQ